MMKDNCKVEPVKITNVRVDKNAKPRLQWKVKEGIVFDVKKVY